LKTIYGALKLSGMFSFSYRNFFYFLMLLLDPITTRDVECKHRIKICQDGCFLRSAKI